MLQAIREKTTGWIAYAIIGLISIPFALAGINSYLGGGNAQPVATVNGEELHERQLDNAYANYRRRLTQMFGGQLPAGFDNEEMLKSQVLDQLIEEVSLRQYSDEAGFQVGDTALNQQIRAMEIFHTDGKFDPELYEAQLRSQGYSPQAFEQEFRRTSAMEHLQQAITATSFVVPQVTEKQQQLANQQRKIRLLTIKNDQSGIELSEDEISDYYQQQSARFKTDQQLKVDYIELKLSDLKQTIEPSEDDLSARYEQIKESLTSDEIRTASHILLSVDRDAGDAESEAVLKKIQALKTELDGGADFAELAKANSQDPGSAANGGSLGEVEKGLMVKLFEDALFAMQPGTVSEPVKTNFGWHLIKLDAVSGGETKSFEEARADLVDEIQTEKAESLIYDLSEKLANISYEQPDSLIPAAEELNLKIQTSDWFSRAQGSGIGEHQKVREAAFSDQVLSKKQNSEGLEITEGHIVFIHLKDNKPAAIKPLEEVKADIEKTLKATKSRELTDEKGKAALARLSTSADFDAIAEEMGLAFEQDGFIDRNARGISRDVLGMVFSMKKSSGTPVFDGISQANGDYSLVELTAVESKSTDVDDESQSVADKALQDLKGAVSRAEYQSVLKAITQNAEVERFSAEEK